MIVKLTLFCSVCNNKHERKITIPGWAGQYECIEREDYLCPDHAGIEPFLHSQCDNCSTCWMDPSCGMFHIIMNKEASETVLSSLRKGRCPFRSSGLSMYSKDANGGLVREELDFASVGKTAGSLLADAIEALINKHEEKTNKENK